MGQLSKQKSETTVLPVNIGIANIPNQRHKIVAKSGVDFNIMLVGTPALMISRSQWMWQIYFY